MIDLTLKAQDQLRKVLAANPNYKFVRIGVRGGGCSGLEYSIGLLDEYDPDWAEYLYTGESLLQVYVDPISEMYLDGTTVDFVESLTESGFRFTNPNVRSQCGCGKSFSA